MKKNIAYTSPLKTAVFMFFIISVSLFHESEKLAHFASGKIADGKNRISLPFYKSLYSTAGFFEDLKLYTGLKHLYINEKSILTAFSDSPVFFKRKETEIKEIKKAEIKTVKSPQKNISIKKTEIKAKEAFKKSFSKKNIKGFSPPYRFLFVGDSMVQSPLGVNLEKRLMTVKRSHITKKGVVSSGLLRPDYFNWHEKLKKYISIYNPNVLVVMLGTNDISSLYHLERKKFYAFNSSMMKKSYRNNVKRLMQIITSHNIKAFWIGLPATEKDEINEKLSVINKIHRDCANKFDNIYYIKTWNLFRNEDESVKKFVVRKGRKTRIRSSDGVHYTETGGDAAGKFIFDSITGTIKNNLAEPEIRYAKRSKEVFRSEILKKEVVFHSYVPQVKKGDEKDRFPVIYLFCGIKRNKVSFYNKHEKYLRWLSQRFGFIIVTPEFPPLWSSRFSEPNNKSFINELIPYVNSKFPVNGLASITGINEGGGGAVKSALENPGTFVSVSSINGIFVKKRKKRITLEESLPFPFKTRILLTERRKTKSSVSFRKEVKELLGSKRVAVVNYSNDRKNLYRYLIDEIKKHFSYHKSSIAFLKASSKPETAHDLLITSIKKGYTDITRDLIMANTDVNTKGADGATPLITAAKYNRYRTAAILIDNGAKPHLSDNSRRNALIHAAIKGNSRILKLLIEKGSKINSKDAEGMTALIHAASRGKFSAVKILLSKGAFINAEDNDKKTALMEAAKENRFKCAKYLIKKGAKIDSKDTLGWTALMKSSLRNNVRMTRLLIKSGANLNVRDLSGRTPLMAASWKGNFKIAVMLVNNGCKPFLQDNSGETSLIKAVKYNKKKVVKFLLSKNPVIDLSDNSTATPLIHCAKNGLYHLAKILIAKGCDIERRYKNNWTPLHLAAMKGHRRVVRLLLKNGAKVNAQSEAGKNALAYATCEAHYETAKLLLDYGADSNLKDTEKLSPLHHAIMNNLKNIAEMIIVRGNLPGQNELYYTKGLLEKHKMNDLKSLIDTVGIVRAGDSFIPKKQFKDALKNYKMAADLEEKNGKTIITPDILSKIALCHFELKEYNKAISFYKETMSYTSRKQSGIKLRMQKIQKFLETSKEPSKDRKINN